MDVPPPSSDDRLYRLLMSAVTGYAIFMLDTDGRIVSWDAGGQRANGYRADEIIGQMATREHPLAVKPCEPGPSIFLKSRSRHPGCRQPSKSRCSGRTQGRPACAAMLPRRRRG